MPRSRVLSLTTVAASLALTGPALAADRFAEPGGDGPNGCLLANPCNIETAVAFASPGDHVRLLPGTHTVSADIDVLDDGVTIEPADPATRPVVASTSNSEPVFSVQPGGPLPTVIRGLEIVSQSNQSDTNHEALVSSRPLLLSDTILRARGRVLRTFNPQATVIEDVSVAQISGVQNAAELESDGTTIRRLTVSAAVGAQGLSVAGAGTQVTDSVVSGGSAGMTVAGGATARRVTASGLLGGIAAAGTATITDAVARATDGGSAILVTGNGAARLRNLTGIATGPGAIGFTVTGATAVADARNLIVRGATTDVRTTGGGTLAIDHSNFRTADGAVSDGGTNQGGDPRFANAGAGDFRLLAGSPATDAGAADDVLGSTDRDGASRFQGAAPDLGAFESAPPAPAPAPAPPVAPGLPGQPTPDASAPVLTSLKAAAKPTRSAKLSFVLNEGASVQVVLQKRTGGRRQGRSCVKATAKLRTAKACSRLVTLVTTRKTVGRGLARLSVGRRLSAGSYRVTVLAKDAAGNRAKPAIASFTVRR